MEPTKNEPETSDLPTNLIHGSCLCGNVKITISDSELFTRRRGHICYCSNCRQASGSFGASNLLIETEKVTIEDIDGMIKEYVDTKTGSGNPVSRFFCSNCGSPIKSAPKGFGDKVVLRMGLFPHIPAPEFETFGMGKYPWQGRTADAIVYKTKIFGEVLKQPDQ